MFLIYLLVYKVCFLRLHRTQVKVGFDWGAFWGMLLLGGLPFFLRKMNAFGFYCLGFLLIESISMLDICFPHDVNELDWWHVLPLGTIGSIFPIVLAIYLGKKGGRLTARHYLEEGYKFHTTDKALLERAKEKWNLEA